VKRAVGSSVSLHLPFTRFAPFTLFTPFTPFTPFSPFTAMLRTDEILSTIQMLHAEHLDVRSVTLGLNLDDCAASNLDHLCRKLRQKIVSRASRLVEVCDRVGAKYGIPVDQ